MGRAWSTTRGPCTRAAPVRRRPHRLCVRRRSAGPPPRTPLAAPDARDHPGRAARRRLAGLLRWRSSTRSSAGLHSTAVHVGATPSRAGVAARHSPRPPPGPCSVSRRVELASTVVGLDDVLGRPARVLDRATARRRRLGCALRSARGTVPRAMGRRAPPKRAPGARLGLAATVRDAAAAIGVQELATEVGWSRRHLTDRFTAEFGLAPKVAARVLRFERAVGRLRQRPDTRLADLVRRLRVRRPGASDPGVARDRRLLAAAVDGRGTPKRSRLRPGLGRRVGGMNTHD